MAVYAIGDIHGHLNVLEKLIKKLNLQPPDHLIFVGDYVDRGPNSLGVIKYIEELKRICRVTTLIGNHEMLMVQSLDIMTRNKTSDISLFNSDDREYVLNWTSDRNGGSKTMESLMNRVPGDNMIIAKFWENLIPDITMTIENKHYTICHSFPVDTVHNDITNHDDRVLQAAWSRFKINNKNIITYIDPIIDMNLLQKNYSNKTIIHGHTPVMSINSEIGEVLEYKIGDVRFINIDIGCAYIEYENNYNEHDSIHNLCALRLGDEMKFYAFD